MKSRPFGITILAILSFSSVAFYGVMATLTVANGTATHSLLVGMIGGGAGPSRLEKMGPALVVYFLFMALFMFALAWGFWNLKNWARIIALALIGVSMIGGAVGIAIAFAGSTVLASISAIARLLIAGLLFWYLCTPSVGSAFRTNAP